jgi:hypothetical protein
VAVCIAPCIVYVTVKVRFSVIVLPVVGGVHVSGDRVVQVDPGPVTGPDRERRERRLGRVRPRPELCGGPRLRPGGGDPDPGAAVANRRAGGDGGRDGADGDRMAVGILEDESESERRPGQVHDPVAASRAATLGPTRRDPAVNDGPLGRCRRRRPRAARTRQRRDEGHGPAGSHLDAGSVAAVGDPPQPAGGAISSARSCRRPPPRRRRSQDALSGGGPSWLRRYTRTGSSPGSRPSAWPAGDLTSCR